MGRKKRFGHRPFSLQPLEPRLALASTAFLGVVQVAGSPADLVVRGIGESDTGAPETFTLRTLDAESGFSGHVVVEISNLDVPGGKIIGAFNVGQLQATAATNGGNFLGFEMFGLAGDDVLDARQLKNFERTFLHGDGRSTLGFAVDAGLSDKDTLFGGQLSRDQYFGGTDATTADGRNDDIVANVDIYDTLPVSSPPFPLAFTPHISGGTGNNTLIFNPDSEGVTINPVDFTTIIGTNGNDNINASGTVGHGVTILGLGGNDTLTGTDARDTIEGGDGNDTIFGLGENDNLSGGAGNDTIHGGDGNDTIFGNDGNDTLNGDAGTDTIEGGIGDDALRGGDGNDTLRGGEGNDLLNGGPGNDLLEGGDGSDTADYSDSPGPVNAYIGENRATNDGWGNTDTYSSIENLRGSAHDDVLRGDGGNNRIDGGAGNDIIDGEGGDDVLNGETGNDRILGGSGDDVLNGGDGNDTLFGEQGTDRLTGGVGSDELDGGLGLDYLEGGPNDLSTDFLYLNYDLVQGAIEDLVAIGGPANRDIFRIQTLEFADNPNAPGAFDPFTPQQRRAGAMEQIHRLDAQFELDARLEPANLIGARLLVFSDFDGGDGGGPSEPTGDVLEFLS